MGGFEAGEGVALPSARLDWPGGAEASGPPGRASGNPRGVSPPSPRVGGGTGARAETAEVSEGRPGRRLQRSGRSGRGQSRALGAQ